jgi:DNA-directed RNA polymerase subunit RPC12/RpoP
MAYVCRKCGKTAEDKPEFSELVINKDYSKEKPRTRVVKCPHCGETNQIPIR